MYSQQHEEPAILKACSYRDHADREPRFLDLGAYHPTEKSNTRALYEIGWGGVMFEPSPGPMKALLKEYGNEPRITLVQAAVGLEAQLLPMWISDDAVSTSDAKQRLIWDHEGGYFGQLLVPTVSLPQIANQFGGFDFVNIDVEGVSVDLFTAALSLGWSPHCFCVEHDNRLAELLTAATQRGYVATMTNDTNVVLVRL